MRVLRHAWIFFSENYIKKKLLRQWQTFGDGTYGDEFLVTWTFGDMDMWWQRLLVTQTFGEKTFGNVKNRFNLRGENMVYKKNERIIPNRRKLTNFVLDGYTLVV